jgi:hypothetical protein
LPLVYFALTSKLSTLLTGNASAPSFTCAWAAWLYY